MKIYLHFCKNRLKIGQTTTFLVGVRPRMTFAARRLLIVSLALLALLISTVRAEEEGTKIKLDEAKANVGKEVIVEFKVESGYFKDDTKPCFLNSKANKNDKENFVVVIFPKTLKDFKEAKIEDPAMHYAGKVIRVKGKVEEFMEKLQIVVKTPKQITLVEEEKKE
jgi:DNA/RNA endonuclease YhcR with UshA esterase domain